MATKKATNEVKRYDQAAMKVAYLKGHSLTATFGRSRSTVPEDP
jgi:hypothetical protein